MGATARIRVAWLVLLLLVAGCAGAKTVVTQEPAPAGAPAAAPKDGPYQGPKARLSVLRLDVKVTTAPAAVGGGAAGAGSWVTTALGPAQPAMSSSRTSHDTPIRAVGPKAPQP